MSVIEAIRHAIGFRTALAETTRAVQDMLDRPDALPPTVEQLELLDWLTRWLDIDDSRLEVVGGHVAAFTDALRGVKLYEAESAHLESARGFMAFHDQRYEGAIASFTYAKHLADHVADDDMAAMTRFLLARCYWKRGNYEEALKLARESRGRAVPNSVQWAIIGMVEAWLLFLEDDIAGAAAVFHQLGPVFEQTEDFINQGNVLSALGRIARHDGNEPGALQLLTRAVDAYEKAPRPHRNIARALTQKAFLMRLEARNPSASPEVRSNAHTVLDDAQAMLQTEPSPHVRLLGTVRNVRALLFADQRRLQAAYDEAAAAYKLAAQKDDVVVMANSRVIQCLVALADGTRHHALEARRFAEQAVGFAGRTSNRRLRLRAQLKLAQTSLALSDPINAQIEWAEADALARHDRARSPKDYMVIELDELQAQIHAAPATDTIVASVSRQDIVGHRLRDIIEKVETSVIRHVYYEDGGEEPSTNATRIRLQCGVRRVNEAVNRELDNDRDKKLFIEELRRMGGRPPQLYRKGHVLLDVSNGAEQELRVRANEFLDRGLAEIQLETAKPLPSIPERSERIPIAGHELYRLKVPPGEGTHKDGSLVQGFKIVYEVVRERDRRTETHSPRRHLGDPARLTTCATCRGATHPRQLGTRPVPPRRELGSLPSQPWQPTTDVVATLFLEGGTWLRTNDGRRRTSHTTGPPSGRARAPSRERRCRGPRAPVPIPAS